MRFQPAVTICGMACAKARKMASEVGPVSELPNVVAAGKRALRKEPSGLMIFNGRNNPALCGMSELISIRKVSSSADAVAEKGALTKPAVCGEEPVKSKVISDPATVTARLIFILEPGLTPS